MRNIRSNRFDLAASLAVALSLFGLAACNTLRGQVPAFAGKLQVDAPAGEQSAVLAGGCFWGVEGVFDHVKGVSQAVSGYSGGSMADPSYEDVSTGTTGYAESVMVKFDPSTVSYSKLLQVFFSVALNPTEVNRQGPDSGTQYRSVIFYANEYQKQVALAYIHQLDQSRVFPAPIATQVVPFKAFHRAEAYHQHFLERHPDYPYIVYNDLPKLRELKKQFPELYKR
jgi:peptide-methionine (S)-S-oxide reductase